MTTYALDTNIIIDFLRKNNTIIDNMNRAYSMGHILAIPSITYYEIIRGFDRNKISRRYKEFYEFCKILELLYFDRNDMKIIDKAAEIYENLRKTGNLIEDNDIYIAATAIANDAVLVTDNIKHFSRIDGLRLVNWKE